jgi:energy-coupling factor transporter ATP-binding protein EcfA2
VKLKKARIENFKGIKGPLEIDFTSPHTGEPRQLTCLLGDNGSGKTTVLQAIALTLSLATRRTEEPARFDWPGFLAERVSSLGPTRVELVVGFEEQEIAVLRELHKEWNKPNRAEPIGSPPFRWLPFGGAVFRNNPPEYREVKVTYSRGQISSSPEDGAWQFLGRFFIGDLMGTLPEKRQLLTEVGDVFWFDQNRNLGTILNGQANGEARPAAGWRGGVEHLREFLVGMWGYHTSPRKGVGKDFIPPLESRFADLFPGTAFRGLAPRAGVVAPGPRDFYFLLERDGRVYDLAEMSSGEQAIFPLVYEFVRLDIAKSIVLIDELELHLHPPEQQALLAALPRIGPDCQFIITTHSPLLADVLPEEEKVRLEGGRRCL